MITLDEAEDTAIELSGYLKDTEFYPDLDCEIFAGEVELACFNAIGNLALTKIAIPLELLERAVEAVSLRFKGDPDVMNTVEKWKPLVNTI